MRVLCVFLFFMFISAGALAGALDIHKRRGASLKGLSAAASNNIRMILHLPLANRNQLLRQYPADSFQILQKIILSPREKMSHRWHSLISLASIYPGRSRPLVQKSLQQSAWFLRNAGLLAMDIIDSKLSLQWASRLLDDPSLVVRTAAVDLIKRRKASQYKLRLLEKFNAKDSFYQNQSLWIRSHIISALADFAEPGEERFFVLALQDPDSRLYDPAMRALAQLTGRTFQPGDIEGRRQKWIEWWLQSDGNQMGVFSSAKL